MYVRGQPPQEAKAFYEKRFTKSTETESTKAKAHEAKNFDMLNVYGGIGPYAPPSLNPTRAMPMPGRRLA